MRIEFVLIDGDQGGNNAPFFAQQHVEGTARRARIHPFERHAGGLGQGAPRQLDLHLRSQAGRWDGSGWVLDAETSPAIDAGHPQDPFALEPAPNGNRANLGAYGNSAQASRSGGVEVAMGGVPLDTYVLFGVPAIPVDGNPDAVLGDDFPGEGRGDPWGVWWRLARWDPAQQDYLFYHEDDLGAPGDPPDILPGRGFWLIQWWSLEHPNGSTEGDTVAVTGTLVPSTQDYVIPLTMGQDGFNQAANPFRFDVDWARVRVRDVGSDQELTVARAAEQGWIDGYAYLWDWEAQVYVPLPADAGGRIRAWRGFWVQQLDGGRRLELRVPPEEAALSRAKPLAVRPVADDWYVEFAVTASVADPAGGRTPAVVSSARARAGVAPGAARRDDVFDALDLPVPNRPYLRAYFPHDDPADPLTYWPGRPARYVYDLRDADWVDQAWVFVVETDLAQAPCTWTWTNPGALPAGFAVAVEDAEADTVVVADLRAQPAFAFSSGPQGQRRFRLRAAYEDVAGDVSGDRAVDALDAVQVLAHVVGASALPGFALAQAEVVDAPAAPRAVTPLDAAWILAYAEGAVAALPAGEATLPTGQRTVNLGPAVPATVGTWIVSLFIDAAEGLRSGTIDIVSAAPEVEVTGAEVALDGFVGAVALGPDRLRLAFAGTAAPAGRQRLARVYLRTSRPGWPADPLAVAAVEFNDGALAARVAATRPEDRWFYPAAPNPFNGQVTLRFGLPADEAVRLAIYDVLGQQVALLLDGRLDAGLHDAVWDGRSTAGHDVASGVYLARLQIGGQALVRKVALIR